MLVYRYVSRCSSVFAPRKIFMRGIATSQPVELASTVYGDVLNDRKHSPLVICHGLFGHKQNWNSVAKAMQRRLGSVIYAVDLRNHGASPKVKSMSYTDMAADLALFLNRKLSIDSFVGEIHTLAYDYYNILNYVCCGVGFISEETGFPKIHLLGHSMGGKASMRLAIDPNGAPLIDRLIIEDVSPKGYSANSHAFRYYIESMKNVDLTKNRQQINKELEGSVPDLAIRQFLLTNLQSAASGNGLEWKVNLSAIEEHFEDVLGFAIPAGAFRGRTLFVYGEKSGYVPNEDRPLIKNIFPQVVFNELKNARHWVHADQPELFIDSVCKFIEAK